jgi:hypothetical protein
MAYFIYINPAREQIYIKFFIKREPQLSTGED